MTRKSAEKRKASANWDSSEAEQKHAERQRRHTLEEDQLFKADNYGGKFATIFSKEETWISQRDRKGLVARTHTLTRTNQESTGRVVKEITEERWDPNHPEKEPQVTTDQEETQLHEPEALHKQSK